MEEKLKQVSDTLNEHANLLSKVAERVDGVIEDTAPLVEAIKAVSSIRKFTLWLGGFALVGSVVAWWVEKLNPPPPF